MFEPVLVAHGREGSVAAVTLNTGLVHYLELETLEQAQGEPQLSCWNRRWTQVTGTAARDPWTRPGVLFAAAEQKQQTIVATRAGIQS
jgi:hypothetical protein